MMLQMGESLLEIHSFLICNFAVARVTSPAAVWSDALHKHRHIFQAAVSCQIHFQHSFLSAAEIAGYCSEHCVCSHLDG